MSHSPAATMRRTICSYLRMQADFSLLIRSPVRVADDPLGALAGPQTTVAVTKRMLSRKAVGFPRKPVVDECPPVEPYKS
jgi:hypothetical protein